MFHHIIGHAEPCRPPISSARSAISLSVRSQLLYGQLTTRGKICETFFVSQCVHHPSAQLSSQSAGSTEWRPIFAFPCYFCPVSPHLPMRMVVTGLAPSSAAQWFGIHRPVQNYTALIYLRFYVPF